MTTDASPPAAIAEGSGFPDLELTALVSGVWGHEHQRLSLGAYAGQWKVLMYWPLEYLWQCADEIRRFASRRHEFQARDAVLIGAAPETRSLLHSWRGGHGLAGALPFPIISDDGRQLARRLSRAAGDASVTVIVDPRDEVRHRSTVDRGRCRTVDGVLGLVHALQIADARGSRATADPIRPALAGAA
jgi:alkyl hydroperoxide reductase subunit AhpC